MAPALGPLPCSWGALAPGLSLIQLYLVLEDSLSAFQMEVSQLIKKK